ncbi:hypothetical protein ACFSO9_15820 [Mesonia maritima]|uniref:hypothetical protein n=1 Tax=Mesonia maritima TaxID=1793873 RepID=UPI00363907AF
MQLSKQILRFPNLLMGITAALVLSSCGSYENSSYNDGIYTAGRSNEETESYTESNDEPSYYENYFSKQGEEIEQAQQANTSTDQVFTDVDSYSSTPQPNNSGDIYYSEDEIIQVETLVGEATLLL